MITYNEKDRIFKLDTKNTTYAFGFLSDFALVHIYYGDFIKNVRFIPDEFSYMERLGSSTEHGMENIGCIDVLPMEFSTFGHADTRLPTLNLKYADGTCASRFNYRNHKIFAGKPILRGLPATYVEDDNEADTLELEFYDNVKNVSVTLVYTVYREIDAITRSMRVKNESSEDVFITRIMSASVDFTTVGNEYDFLHLNGAWVREFKLSRDPLICGSQEVYSRRGTSSHHHNPFFAMVHRKADENSGNVYGFNLIYSGNFTGGIEVDTYETARCYIGINSFNFNWKLETGEEFQSPEAVLTFSSSGISGMSQIYHKLYRTRLCRGDFRDANRPILINNWEGTRFDFTEEKIVAIAEKASKIGLELMVLDDGWFGKRNDDHSSLGDWKPNLEKLPNGLNGLADKVNALGMKFGLWFEPEMISPDSDLYRVHPDWAIHLNNRTSSLGRYQLILDLSRKEICDFVISSVADILNNTNIEYVKWDMNRTFSEFGSVELPADRMGEFAHRYMLGLYYILETLTSKFPNVLFEGCASGGGRFDGGILYYMPQIWVSDCSDAGERLSIQYGCSLCYPTSSMGCHVSAIPNHQTGRLTSMKTRGDVAMMGQLGFELDMSLMTDEDLEAARKVIEKYRKYRDIFHNGNMYRISSPFESNEAIFQFISEDEKTVILLYSNKHAVPYGPHKRTTLVNLDPNANYIEIEDEISDALITPVTKGHNYFGYELMKRGLIFMEKRDYSTAIHVFRKED